MTAFFLLPRSRRVTTLSVVTLLVGLVCVPLLAGDDKPTALTTDILGESSDGPADMYDEPVGTSHNYLTYVPPAPIMWLGAKTATFKVAYDENFPYQARASLQTALDLWSAMISSPVPIEVEAKYVAMEDEEKKDDKQPARKTEREGRATVLARCRPTQFRRDFKGAPRANTWYPIALASKIGGMDLNPAVSDIVVTLNSKVDNWYFGSDGAAPRNKYDLLTILLHEIGHGLGLSTSLTVKGKEGHWGIPAKDNPKVSPTIFDRFVVSDRAGEGLRWVLDVNFYANPSENLGKELTTAPLFFNGRHAIAANGGKRVPLNVETTFKAGRSLTHLDEASYAPGQLNSLMTPVFGCAEAVHHPGPVFLGILHDLGW